MIKGLAATLGMGLAGWDANAANGLSEAVLPDQRPRDAPVGRIWVSPPDCYFVYPHSNGFLPGGNPVIGRIAKGGGSLTYLEWDFHSGETRPLFQTTPNNMYWDVAERTGDLAAPCDRRSIVALSTRGAPTHETLLQIDASRSARLEDLVSISAVGDKVLYGVLKPGDGTTPGPTADLFEFDRHDQRAGVLASLPFNADHPHYCPHDESWIGFAHDGDIRASLDRVWGLNRGMNFGRPIRIWDETLPGEGVGYVGHERWAFHATGALAVVYSDSPGHPWGLYYADALTRRARLVSASDYDWHCNISRDGAWAVVDTAPPPHVRKEADGRTISDIVLVRMSNGRRHWLARSHKADLHPWHPHPHFSPDGKFVIYNDYQRDGAGGPSYTVIVELAPIG